jgi:DNA-directed RNA polymerase specialized sigma24 family protein
MEVDMSENERLAALIRSGDPERISRALCPIARRMVRAVLRSADRDLIEMAVSDTLLAVCRYHHTFAGRSRATTWLYTIARREALKCVYRAGPVQNFVSLSDDDVCRAVEIELAVTPAIGERLDAAVELKSLVSNPDWRRIWLVKNAPGANRSHEDVARLTGYTAGSVAATLSKVRRRLEMTVHE